MFLTDSELCGRCRLSDFGRFAVSAILGGSALGLTPSAHPPPPFPPTACQAPPFPLLSPFQNSRESVSYGFRTLWALPFSPRPPPSSPPPPFPPTRPPPSSPPPPPFPPTACQAPPFPLLSPFQNSRECFLRIQNFAGIAVSAILGGSPLGLPPLAHPPASPPQALLPSPLSRPSKIQ